MEIAYIRKYTWKYLLLLTNLYWITSLHHCEIVSYLESPAHAQSCLKVLLLTAPKLSSSPDIGGTPNIGRKIARKEK